MSRFISFFMMLFCLSGLWANEAYPPAHYVIHGQTLNVDGQKIWAEQYGSGSPVIVLFNGAGDTVREWNAVIPALSQISTVVGFDYPGLGKSGAPAKLTQPMTAKEIAKLTLEVLQQLHLKPPYILVGHSIGGLYISYFARAYPNEVAGIVTVDGNTVSQVFMHKISLQGMLEGAKAEIQKFIKDGALRNKKLQQQVETLDAQKPLTAENTTTIAYDEEVLGKTESAKETKASGPLPHVPLIALSEGASDSLDDQIWHASIEQFSEQVPCSIFKVVPNTRHYIQIDQPQYVITAVKSVLNAIKMKSDLCSIQITWPD